MKTKDELFWDIESGEELEQKLCCPSMKQQKGINRRQFLIATGLMTVAGAHGLKAMQEIMAKQKFYDIYNVLQSHVYNIKGKSKYSSGLIKKFRGMGIVYDGHMFTVAHIVKKKMDYQRSPFGMMSFSLGDVIENDVRLFNQQLDEVVVDRDHDFAIYRLPKKMKETIQDFPCEAGDVYSGDRVYIIGNQQLQGRNTREARVSSLTGYKGVDYEFTIDETVMPGDSGCPIVNDDYKLVGQVSATHGADRSYITRAATFIDSLDEALSNTVRVQAHGKVIRYEKED